MARRQPARDPETGSANRTALAYLRVSTDRQATDDKTSLADQRNAIEGLAGRLGVVIEEWFTDPGASGATVEGRPGFRALLAACERRALPQASPGSVLVLNASRFGRFEDPEEGAYWRHHLRRLGWVVRFVEGDVEGDASSIVRAVAGLEASTYRRNLIANTRRGMKGAAGQGFWTREAPFGYRRLVVHPRGAERVLEIGQLKAPDEKVKLTPRDDEAKVVVWMFQTYAAGGESLGSLAESLRRRVPGRQWSRTAVAAMLQNPAYRGAVVGGHRRNEPSEPYGCEDAHPAIVGAELWNSVQERLGKNARMGQGARSHYLLSGLLKCVHCGATYAGGGGGQSRSHNPERSHRRFYRDSGGISGTCPGKIGTVMRHLVDDATIGVIAEALGSPAVRQRIERGIDDALVSVVGAGGSDSDLRAERARIEQRRERLVSAVADGTLLPTEASAQIESARAALAAIDARLQVARFAQGRLKAVRAERDRLVALALDFPAQATRLEGPALRRLVEPWLAGATFDKVSRTLTLSISTVPATTSLGLYGQPRPTCARKGARSTSPSRSA